MPCASTSRATCCIVMRNEIPLEQLIAEHLDWPSKRRDGRFLFVCPRCGESQTAVNPRTNLGRCFRCEENFSAIDFVMLATQRDFVEAVHFLSDLLPPRPSFLRRGWSGGPVSCDFGASEGPRQRRTYGFGGQSVTTVAVTLTTLAQLGPFPIRHAGRSQMPLPLPLTAGPCRRRLADRCRFAP